MPKDSEILKKQASREDIYLVICIFRPDKLEEFKVMSKKLDLPGATITRVLGFGRQKGHIELFRGDEYEIEFIEKVKAEIVVSEPKLHDLLDNIREYLRTGRIGDGKLFIIKVENAMRIRTGEGGLASI